MAATTFPVDDSYSSRVWLTEEGLPENRVVGMAQASDGYLWVATLAGVVRFDGVRFLNFESPAHQSLSFGTMQGLLRDRGGRFWVAKELGVLHCADSSGLKTWTRKNGLPEAQAAISMAEDSEGSIWISYSKGAVVRVKNGTVENFSTTNGLPPGGACWLTADKSGQLWFARNGQVGVFRNEGFIVLLETGTSATRIAPARDEGIWICTPRQLSRYSEAGGLVKRGDYLPIQSGSEPAVLLEDRDGVVWVGTDAAGLFRCDAKSSARVETSHLSILGLAEDREGNLWVGTRGGGLNRVHRRLAAMITSADGLPFAGVQSVCADTVGGIWAVGDNGVLARRSGQQWEIMNPEPGSANINCTCVAADGKGSVWVGTRGGRLFRWENGKFTHLGLRDRLQRKLVRSLLVARNGDLWIATDGSDVLYQLQGEELNTVSLRAGFRFIRAMTEDAAGNIWVGASDGLLARVTGETVTDFTSQPIPLSIRCLYATTNGDVWIGYAGSGVGRFRDGQLLQFDRNQGLPNNYVSQILADDRGRLWFAGNQGIFQVRESDFEDVAIGRANAVQPFLYGRSEGMQGIQASFDFCPNSVRSSDGRLYFSMLTGLAEVRPDRARNNRLPPPVCIERVTADGQTYAVYMGGKPSATGETEPLELSNPGDRPEIRFPPGRQNVRFDFSALSFAAPENIQFRYRLEGLDDRWVNADARRFAEYTHPEPGKYRFHVIACNNDGVWNETGDSIPVVFEAYFWEKLWFKVGATAAFFTILFGTAILILRRRHQRQIEQLERQRALELERTRIARDLHDDLGVGLTEIGLLGDLAGSSGELPPPSRERLQEITGRARSLVGALDEIVWAINPTNDSSQSLMDYLFPYAQKLLSRANIRCRLHVTEPLPAGKLNAERRHEFFHAFKEALNNIIRHSGATQVLISFEASENNLVVRVADNGRGLDNKTDAELSHHGLAGMRERLQKLGGRCDVNTAASGGTTVTFILPVQSES